MDCITFGEGKEGKFTKNFICVVQWAVRTPGRSAHYWDGTGRDAGYVKNREYENK